jgi:uncharacterized protein (TIGR02596 family)
MKSNRLRIAREGFTLIEVLAVLAISSILAFETISMVQGVVDAQNVQGAALMVRGQLELARQIAITKDEPVQCRLYQNSANTGFFALRAVFDGTEIPVMRLNYLPTQIVITNSEAYSTLKQAAAVVSGVDTVGIYIAFRYRVDGSTDLDPTSTYTMTLLTARNGVTATRLPSNFITLELDPITGKTKSFQP